jgi:hypothetical protein
MFLPVQIPTAVEYQGTQGSQRVTGLFAPWERLFPGNNDLKKTLLPDLLNILGCGTLYLKSDAQRKKPRNRPGAGLSGIRGRELPAIIPNTRAGIIDYQAGGRGFEPRHTDPESAVLPLDEPPIKVSKRSRRLGI